MTSQKHISMSLYGVQITGVKSHTEMVSIVQSHIYTTPIFLPMGKLELW